ncbi:MAG: TetR family transcriptional regulator [Micrococcus sp.]|nr:TetR family transcriptional regulator [Micrococcus sp.]
MARSSESLLDDALAVLRQGQVLTLDAVARQAGMTKPGVVHHFPTKEALSMAVVDHVVDRWEAELNRRIDPGADALGRLRAYVHWTLTGDFDPSDLAMLADARLRDRLRSQWVARLDPWFGTGIEGPAPQRAAYQAARLLADGAWINQCLGVVTLDHDERQSLLDLALGLIDQGTRA